MEYIKSNGSFNDLVFENRNKEYGAYILRKSYDDHVLKSMGIAFSIVVLLFILSFIKKEEEKVLYPNHQDNESTVITRPVRPDNPKPVKPNTRAKSQMTNNPVLVATDTVIMRKVDTTNAGTAGPNNNALLKGDTLSVIGAGPGINPEGPPKIKDPVAVPDENPKFPGGEEEMYKFIRKYLRYPQEAIAVDKQGTVYVSFIVDADGKINEVKTRNKIGDGCDEAAMRVVKMMPDWKPGVLNGAPVPVVFTLRVTFKLK